MLARDSNPLLETTVSTHMLAKINDSNRKRTKVISTQYRIKRKRLRITEFHVTTMKVKKLEPQISRDWKNL